MKDRSKLVADIYKRSGFIIPISLYNDSRSITNLDDCKTQINISESSEIFGILSQSLIWESFSHAHKMHWQCNTLHSYRELSVRVRLSFLSGGFCMGDGRRFS